MQRKRPQRLSREQIWQMTYIALSIFTCGMICSMSTLYFARRLSSDASIYINQGIEQYGVEDYQGAIESFNTAEERDPDQVETYYWRGQSYAAINEHELAIADYTRTLELEPGFTDAYYLRGVSQEALGDHAAAIDDYTTYLNQGGEDPDAAERLLALNEASDE